MASRPAFKQESSFNGGNSFEMKSMENGGKQEEVRAPASPIEQDQSESDRFQMTYGDHQDRIETQLSLSSMFGYALILGNGWVLATIGIIAPLMNGGTAGGIWSYFITICGLSFTTLSMAEMTSMAPTAGGQYHWASEFAPPSSQKFLSYVTGWLCVLGWQTALCSTAYSAALAAQGIIAINMEGYEHPAWHGVLFTIAVVLSTIIFNTVLLRKLPTFEGIMVTVHIFAFIAVLVTIGLAFCKWIVVGILILYVVTYSAFCIKLTTFYAAHLSEELQDASWVLPRSMIATATANYSFCFLMVITFMTVKGATVEELLDVPYMPYIKIFENITQSTGGATALTTVILILLLFGIINQVTTTSRQLYAFARDRGMPFSGFLSYVRPGWDVPLNAVTVTLIFSILVSFIILGSPVAFFTLGSLCQSALYASYLMVIACIAHRRLTGGTLPPTKFSLGRASVPVNFVAITYLSVQFVFILFPVAPNPDAPNFPWAVLVFLVTIFGSIGWYIVRGRFDYLGPVEYVRKVL